MKKFNILKSLILVIAIFSFTSKSNAQLSDGTIAPNWTLKDINGTNYTLYNYLAQGKRVVIDFSAVWCPPCWAYHTSGALEGVYNSYGPTGTINQTMEVFFVEADENSLACLQGTGCSTQGDWTAGTPYPMFLTCSPPSGNGPTVNSNYNIAYFPTVYTVCPDHTIYESGQLTTSQHYSFANSNCAPLSTTVNDVKAFSCSTPNIIYCVGTLSPSFTIQNYGTANLTSCNVTVKLDGNTCQTTSWTGNLAMYSTAVVAINQITGILNGAHTLTIELDSPNGVTDENISNNSINKSFNVMITPTTIPISQNFTSSTFPPSGYDAVDVTNDGYNWARSSTAGHTAAGSTYMKFYNISSGDIDDLKLPLLDFTGYNSPVLTFWLAHRRYSTSYSDKLEVDVSTNCGTSWVQKWMKSGATLATNATLLTSQYTSPVAGDWRQETVDLSAYQGMSNIMIRFRATSGYGNNAFVDDINITGITGIDNSILYKQILLYPNPSNGELFVLNAENSNIEIIDILGKVVYSALLNSNNEQLNLTSLSNGSYLARITNQQNVITRNIVLAR